LLVRDPLGSDHLSSTSVVLVAIFVVFFIFDMICINFLISKRLKSTAAMSLAKQIVPFAAAFQRARDGAGAMSGDLAPEYNVETEIATGRAAEAGVQLPAYTSTPLENEYLIQTGGPVEGDIGLQRFEAVRGTNVEGVEERTESGRASP